MSQKVANDNQKSIKKTSKNGAETLQKSMKKTFVFLYILGAILRSFGEDFEAHFRINGSLRAMLRPHESIGPASKSEGLGIHWGDEKQRKMGIIFSSVSYTHLTLPTKA